MHDVALVYELDQGTAIALKQKGVTDIDGLLKRFDKDSLAELKKPRGNKMVRVGVAAESEVMKRAEKIYAELTERGVDVILDDRNVQPGVKFKDSELTGFPIRIGIGDYPSRTGRAFYAAFYKAIASAAFA